MNTWQKWLLATILSVFLLGIFAPNSTQVTQDTNRTLLFEAVNRAREDNNAPALTLSEVLSRVAQSSIETVGITGSYSAISIDSVGRLLNAEAYRYATFWYVMQANMRDMNDVVATWMTNYRNDMLSTEFTEIGTGYYIDRYGDSYMMILLARRGESVLPTTMPAPCANPIPPYAIAGQDLTSSKSPERVAQIRVLTDLYDTLVQNWLNDAIVPGAVIGLIDSGEFVWVRAYGYRDARTYARMTTDMVFGVASLSKPIASVATMQLVEHGVITLDTPVFDVINTWRPDTPYDIHGITPYRLMSHTAGFPTANSPIFGENYSPLPSLIDSLNGIGRRGRAVTLENPPGTTFAYSNGGYSVLQLFLETVTGEPFADYARCHIFEPLGMRMSDFYLRPDIQRIHATGHNEAGDPLPDFQMMVDLTAAGLHTSVPDFARWIVAMLADENTPNILSKGSIKLMMSPAEGTNEQYGLGFYLTNWQGTIIPNHTGSTPGFRSYFQILPDKRHAIIVLTNSSNGEIFNNRVTGQWLQWLKSIGDIQGLSAEQLEAERRENITRLIQLINDERARYQLPPLLTNELVMRDAQSNSQMMASRDDVDGHDMGRFPERMTSLNYFFDYYYYWSAFGSQLDAQGAFNVWKNRESTFAQLFLDETFDEIGIGLSTSGNGVNYYAVIVVRR
ncbi:MAG: hypothetical protein CUN52_06325 [Phototrophicales bacterium]|nr:MAG: hypothetical protein CUN52_06325 [Phototrophicales bacterium]